MLRLLVLLSWSALALALPRRGLYPFGEEQGDRRLPVGDDISSEEIQLTTPVAFYDDLYQSLFVNLNGHVSFDTELPAYKSDLIIPIGFRVIAPFLADVDNRLSGNVYYRETMDPSLLGLASKEITGNWPSRRNFRAQHLFIVTWEEVGYYDRQYDKVNTFQLVLANSGTESYAMFHYTDDGIQWIKGQGKDRPIAADVPAQVGFDAGDTVRYTTLPGSGSENIKDLSVLSNIGVPGVWVYRIGLTSGGNAEAPETYVPPGLDRTENILPGIKTCANGGAGTCSQNARCQDYQGGFCCECATPFYGNGKHCLQDGTPMRVNGKVTGTVNGIDINSQDLHSYVVTKDGRAHTAISRIEESIGVPLQSAYSIGGVIGWLFARPTSPRAKNGFMLTGGAFNRTARIQYVDGGQTLEVRQQFSGLDAQGYMRVNTQLNGNLPQLQRGAKVTVDDYSLEFSKVGRGLIKSYSTQLYNVDGIPKRINVDQTIRFDECTYRPDDDATMLRLRVIRNFLVYGERDQIVRFAQTNKISTFDEGTDPCREGLHECDANANCIASGDTYRCDCKAGYYGDGRRCVDEDECLRGNNDCSPQATCFNSEGSYSCRCQPGYRGDGKTCISELSCSDISCDRNARCLRNDQGVPVCQCNPGYYGDGSYCEAVEFGCNEVNNCGENAECLYDEQAGRYQCECMDGFSGDGYHCSDTDHLELNCRSCDKHARCIYDLSRLIFRCQCFEGYTGDGNTCSPIYEGDEDCNILNNCDANARCIYDAETRGYSCICNPGFRGDGFRCQPDQVGPISCDVANNCDLNARCTYMDQSRRYECRCNPGYAGDGYRCLEDCSVRNYCDPNAQCVYDDQYKAYTCACRPGFEGDGRRCRQAEQIPGTCGNNVDNCHKHADCIQRYDGQFVCRCNPGYVGDGRFCHRIGDCNEDPGVCDRNARCTRRGGLYVCECQDGYQGDGRRCAPVGDQDSYLLFTQGTAIVQVPFQPSRQNPGRVTLLVPGQTAIGIDVDCYSKYFYWTDVSGHTVSKAKLDGSDSEVILRGLSSPEGVAVDWISGTIYWTDSGSDKIEVARVDGTYRKTLFDTNLVNPRAIGIDPANGLMFWTDWNRDAPKVESAYMDGSQRTVVVSENLGLPNGLTINYDQREVCWADAEKDNIECAGYDGRGRRTIFSKASYPFGLAYANDKFYWTDWVMKGLQNIGRYGGQPNEALTLPVGGSGRTYGLAVVKSQCPRGSNACAVNNGGCRYLCLPTPNGGRTCACPDDVDEGECNTVIRK